MNERDMNFERRLSLNSDDRMDHLRNRSFLESLGDFVPRSGASRALSLDPDATTAKILSLLEDFALLWSESKGCGEEFLLRKDGHVVSAYARQGHLAFELLSRGADARAALDALARRFDPLKFRNKEADGVWAEFAHLHSRGLTRNTQFLRCPAWDDIRENYAPRSRASLERLFRMKKPWTSGRLIIWHGPPGTGKTYALRALMMLWKDTFDFIVINDPENLASDPGYYYQVASGSSEAPRRYLPHLQYVSDADESGEAPRGADQRRVFILEDTADLILEESRSSHFDKIGKLLNMTDGLFGQGREDVFLLTFNEDVSRIDPAFLRPGRCIAKMEFPKFSAAEADAWLRTRGVGRIESKGDLSLAELYAKLLEGENGSASAAEGTRRLGFSPGKTG